MALKLVIQFKFVAIYELKITWKSPNNIWTKKGSKFLVGKIDSTEEYYISTESWNYVAKLLVQANMIIDPGLPVFLILKNFF